MPESITLETTPAPAAAPTEAPKNVTVAPDGSVRVSPPEPVAPTLILGKFKDTAALEAAYKELESKLGKPAETVAPVAAPTPEAAAKAVTDAGVDLNTAIAEIAKDGKMSEKTVAALKAKGIEPAQAELVVQGLKANADKFAQDISEPAGGLENYNKMREWAKANVDAAELAGFDKAILSGDPALAKLAVRGLAAQFAEAAGNDPSLVTGASVPGVPGIKPFASNAQMVEAMSNPKYETDEAYRAEVHRRIEAGLKA